MSALRHPRQSPTALLAPPKGALYTTPAQFFHIFQTSFKTTQLLFDKQVQHILVTSPLFVFNTISRKLTYSLASTGALNAMMHYINLLECPIPPLSSSVCPPHVTKNPGHLKGGSRSLGKYRSSSSALSSWPMH